MYRNCLAVWHDCYRTWRRTVKRNGQDQLCRVTCLLLGFKVNSREKMDRISLAEWRHCFQGRQPRENVQVQPCGVTWLLLGYKMDSEEKMDRIGLTEWHGFKVNSEEKLDRIGLSEWCDCYRVSRWTAKRKWTGSTLQNDAIVTRFQGEQQRENGQDRPCRVTSLLLDVKVDSEEKMDRISLAEWLDFYWTSRRTAKRKWTGAGSNVSWLFVLFKSYDWRLLVFRYLEEEEEENFFSVLMNVCLHVLRVKNIILLFCTKIFVT